MVVVVMMIVMMVTAIVTMVILMLMTLVMVENKRHTLETSLGYSTVRTLLVSEWHRTAKLNARATR